MASEKPNPSKHMLTKKYYVVEGSRKMKPDQIHKGYNTKAEASKAAAYARKKFSGESRESFWSVMSAKQIEKTVKS